MSTSQGECREAPFNSEYVSLKLFAFLGPCLLLLSLGGCGKATDESAPSGSGSNPSAEVSRPSDDAVLAEQVQGDLRNVREATVTGDIDTVLRYAHPKLIELAGGQQEFVTVVERQLSEMKNSQVSFSELTFPSPPEFIQTRDRLYAVVPQQFVMSVPAAGIETKSFQLGVLEKGSSQWTYIDVSKFDRETLEEWFPDFPADYTFPEVSMKQL